MFFLTLREHVLILYVVSRGVHGSVRFGLDLKNQPNRITVFF